MKKKTALILIAIVGFLFLGNLFFGYWLRHTPRKVKISTVVPAAKTATCASDKECSGMDCSEYEMPGLKEGHQPYCVEGKCQCMCYGCK